MSQLSLFLPKRTEPVRRPPDLAYIRKSLNGFLRLAREAEIMPWSESETRSLETRLPERAELLPANEAESWTFEFRSELTRLQAAETGCNVIP